MMDRVVLTDREEFLAKRIVHAAYIIHMELGPALLEKVYESCMFHLLKNDGLTVKRQVIVPVQFQGLIFDDGLRLDLLVEDTIVCEIKAINQVNPVWEAQILSHLKLTNKRLGFLINFHVPTISQGIRRYHNNITPT